MYFVMCYATAMPPSIDSFGLSMFLFLVSIFNNFKAVPVFWMVSLRMNNKDEHPPFKMSCRNGTLAGLSDILLKICLALITCINGSLKDSFNNMYDFPVAWCDFGRQIKYFINLMHSSHICSVRFAHFSFSHYLCQQYGNG